MLAFLFFAFFVLLHEGSVHGGRASCRSVLCRSEYAMGRWAWKMGHRHTQIIAERERIPQEEAPCVFAPKWEPPGHPDTEVTFLSRAKVANASHGPSLFEVETEHAQVTPLTKRHTGRHTHTYTPCPP